MSFEMFAGDTMRVYFAIKDKDGGSLDITGADIRWQISRLKATGFYSTQHSAFKQDDRQWR